jgi:Putative serine esterase (DUF676)
MIHLIVLAHGWMGNPKELGYLQTALERQAAAAIGSSSPEAAVNIENNKDSEDPRPPTPPPPPCLVLVHSAASNNERTSDGIAAGGTRLAAEINAWIDEVIVAHPCSATTSKLMLSLSMVGNSLGGLYARYALKDIQWSRQISQPNANTPTEGDIDEDSKRSASSNDAHPPSTVTTTTVHIQPAVFCTTATPHLGVAAPHTYLPLGTWGEYATATAIGETGRDLFRVESTVIQDMAVDPAFTLPLAQFRKRIAVANAHNTDFQVPCSTAAFLSKTDSIHKLVDTSTTTTDSSSRSPRDDGAFSFVALTVETEPQQQQQQQQQQQCVDNDDDTQVMASDDLAVRLDALGWTKIFCDVRSSLPSIPIPSWPLSQQQQQEQQQETTTTTKDVYTSKELWDRFATFLPSDPSEERRLHFPLGHSVLVANAKNDVYARFNAAGQPVMEQLAADLIREIVQQPLSETNEVVMEND